jgi:hypothetical protein
MPFSEAVRYQDGVSVGIAVERYTPSTTATGTSPGQIAVKVTVTVDNGSSSDLDVSSATVDITCEEQPEAARINDPAGGLGEGLQGTVPAGQSLAGAYAFSVTEADLARLVIEVTPNAEHATAVFADAVS